MSGGRKRLLRPESRRLIVPSLCRYARAERDLKQARPFGIGAQAFYEQAGIEPTTESPKELLVAVTSDRGNEHHPFEPKDFF